MMEKQSTANSQQQKTVGSEQWAVGSGPAGISPTLLFFYFMPSAYFPFTRSPFLL
jgi:hypothetical protein